MLICAQVSKTANNAAAKAYYLAINISVKIMQLTTATKATTATTATTSQKGALSNVKKVTKRSIAITLFNAAILSNKYNLQCNISSAAMRKLVLTQIMQQCVCSLASAAAMYNIAKKLAVKQALINDFSKSAKKAAQAAAQAASTKPQNTSKKATLSNVKTAAQAASTKPQNTSKKATLSNVKTAAKKATTNKKVTK